jgi:hypothetical protein
MTHADAEARPTQVTAVTVGRERARGSRFAAFARWLPVGRLARVAEIVAARIQLGIGGVALTILAQLVGDLVPSRRR